MNFDDTQLQACFERNLAEAGGASAELCHVRALIATHDWFRMIEGGHSSRVHETIDHLLSPKLRRNVPKICESALPRRAIKSIKAEPLHDRTQNRVCRHQGETKAKQATVSSGYDRTYCELFIPFMASSVRLKTQTSLEHLTDSFGAIETSLPKLV